jgi:hypothetical protein
MAICRRNVSNRYIETIRCQVHTAQAGRKRIAGALAPDHGPVAPSATSLRAQAPGFHGRLEDALADCQRGPQLPARRNNVQCQGLLLRTRAIIRLATGNPWTRCGPLSRPSWTSSRAPGTEAPPSEASPATAHAKRPPLTRGTTGYVLDLADYTGQPEPSRSADLARWATARDHNAARWPLLSVSDLIADYFPFPELPVHGYTGGQIICSAHAPVVSAVSAVVARDLERFWATGFWMVSRPAYIRHVAVQRQRARSGCLRARRCLRGWRDGWCCRSRG